VKRRARSGEAHRGAQGLERKHQRRVVRPPLGGAAQSQLALHAAPDVDRQARWRTPRDPAWTREHPRRQMAAPAGAAQAPPQLQAQERPRDLWLAHTNRGRGREDGLVGHAARDDQVVRQRVTLPQAKDESPPSRHRGSQGLPGIPTGIEPQLPPERNGRAAALRQ